MMALAAAPANYASIPLDYRSSHSPSPSPTNPSPSSSSSVSTAAVASSTQTHNLIRLPLHIKRDREAARAKVAGREPGRAYTPFFVPERILYGSCTSGSHENSSSGSSSNSTAVEEEEPDQDEAGAAENLAQHTGSQQSFTPPAPPLLRLPPELLLLILQKIQVPCFQVVFSLTCKSLARLVSENREVLGQWRGWRDKEGLFRLLERAAGGATTAAVLPRGLPREKRSSLVRVYKGSLAEELEAQRKSEMSMSTTMMENECDAVVGVGAAGRLSSYIPAHLTLCRACWRYLPASQDSAYWRFHPLLNSSTLIDDFPHINWFDIINFFATGKNNCGQHKCPECVVRGYQAFMSEREYQRALAEDWRDEEVWLGDLGESGGRRVCLGLPGRLARP